MAVIEMTAVPMTVAQLIAELQTFPQDLLVAYRLFSEHCLVEARSLGIVDLCYPRPDGWIQNKRPDMPTMKYLLLPG
jgi:hypothetical protein